MVNSKANMLVRQKVNRTNTKALVKTANGSANPAITVSNPWIMRNGRAVRMIHSAIPNTSNLARFVLQQQNSTVTGIIRT